MKKRSNIIVFSVIILLVVLFYGGVFKTWFQQDEWDWWGRYTYMNSVGGAPFLEAFKSSFFPHPRYRFTPFFDTFYAAEVYFFGLNFTGYVVVSLVLHALNSLLVFVLTKKLSKSIWVSFLAAAFFATSGVGQKAITWVFTSTNTAAAALFSLLTLIIFTSYLNNKKRSYLIFTYILFFIALWFKETSLSLAFILPTFTFFQKTKKGMVKKVLGITAIFSFVYFFLRFALSRIGAQIHTQGYPDFGRFLSIGEYAKLATWAPFRSLVDVFIVPDTLYKFGRFLTPIFWPQFKVLKNTTRFGLFSETSGVDLATLFLLIPVSIILYSIYKLLAKKKIVYKKTFVLAIILILSSSIVSMLLSIRGASALLHIFRSRDLYLATAGSSMAISLLLFSLWKKSGSIGRFILIFLTGAFLLYNWSYINKSVIAGEIEKATRRKPTINAIYQKYPTLPKKVIFYGKSNQEFYGHNIKTFPFQTGFGRTLLVWYTIKNDQLPKEFVQADFLYYPLEEGYKEIGEYGFGYFRDFDKLEKALLDNSLESDNVIALEYQGELNMVKDITSDIRKKLDEKIRSN